MSEIWKFYGIFFAWLILSSPLMIYNIFANDFYDKNPTKYCSSKQIVVIGIQILLLAVMFYFGSFNKLALVSFIIGLLSFIIGGCSALYYLKKSKKESMLKIDVA